MLFSVISPLFSLIIAISAFQFPPFNGINQHSKVGNVLEFSEVQARRASHSNEVVECHIEDILNIIKLEDIQILIEALATRTAISPFLILNKLYRRMRSRDGVNEVLINTIEGSPHTEIPFQAVMEFPDAKIPLESSRAPYSLSPHASIMDDNKDENIVIVPVAPSSINRTPNMVKMGHLLKKDSTFTTSNMKPVVEEMSNILPGVFVSPGKHNRLKPLLGASVRFSSGDPLNPITREISVTVSPLMTFIEALRQAESKYQTLLGWNDDSEIITFGHSAATDCYVVNSIADIVQSEEFRWKVTVTDRDNQVIYDSFCLPNNKDILVKPGSVISLTYVPI